VTVLPFRLAGRYRKRNDSIIIVLENIVPHFQTISISGGAVRRIDIAIMAASYSAFEGSRQLARLIGDERNSSV
jgi:hypothetical protein